MSQNDLLEKLKDIAGESQVRTDEPMSSHTTFRIGGTADYFVMPSYFAASSFYAVGGEYGIDRRNNNQGNQGGYGKTPSHGHTHRAPHLGTLAGPHRHRDHTQNGRQRCHQYRAKTGFFRQSLPM